MSSLRDEGDRGRFLASFVVVAPLLLLATMGVAQTALVALVQDRLLSAAADGARAGARAVDLDLAVRSAGAAALRDVSLASVDRVVADLETIGGLDVVTVRMEAEVPLLGLLGSTRVEAEGHAIVDDVDG